jgi:aminoglycoside phosphotransferase (APT) family kinase protein
VQEAGRLTASGPTVKVASAEVETRHRIGQGREAEILAWGEGKVLRLMWKPERRPLLEREAAAMIATRAAGAPVPEVHEMIEFAGRPGLVMERVDGPDLLTLLGKQPWRALWTARTCGEAHARLHGPPAPPELPPLRTLLNQQISSSAALSEELRSFALEELSRLPDGDRICHGDFHPGNMLLGPDGPLVVDWTAASRGDPMADVARALLLLRLGELPPEAPPVLRRLERAGRTLLRRGYVRAYGRAGPFDRQRLERWQPVLLAGRLAEGIEAERAKLLDLLDGSRYARQSGK